MPNPLSSGQDVLGSRSEAASATPRSVAYSPIAVPGQRKVAFIALLQGFASRYLLQSEIVDTMVEDGWHVVVLTPGADEAYFRETYGRPGLSIEPLRTDVMDAWRRRAALDRYLTNVRQLVTDLRRPLPQVLHWLNVYRKGVGARSPRQWLRRAVTEVLLFPLRRSARAREALVRFETRFLCADAHADLFKRYAPSLVVTTSPGNQGYDPQIMREAKRHKARVAVVMINYDNSTTKGMRGAPIDAVAAWTPVMRQELIDYHDVPADRVMVGGVANYDPYFRGATWSREEWARRMGLDPARRTLVYFLMSPTRFPHNPRILRMLDDAIGRELPADLQIVARLHPIYFSTKGGGMRHADSLRQIDELRPSLRHTVLDYPTVLSEKLLFDMPAEEHLKVASTLAHSDVLACYFSSMLLEASIFDLPCVNVALYDLDRQPLEEIYKMVHISRVKDVGAYTHCSSEEEFFAAVRRYLDNPSAERAERARLMAQETATNPGQAGRTIGRWLAAGAPDQV